MTQIWPVCRAGTQTQKLQDPELVSVNPVTMMLTRRRQCHASHARLSDLRVQVHLTRIVSSEVLDGFFSPIQMLLRV